MENHNDRKLGKILEKIYHAGKYARHFALEEAKMRMKKRGFFKEMYDAIDELALHNKTRRKGDSENHKPS